jgi:hypothetical protein
MRVDTTNSFGMEANQPVPVARAAVGCKGSASKPELVRASWFGTLNAHCSPRAASLATAALSYIMT